MKITIPEIPPSLNKYAGRANAWDYRWTVWYTGALSQTTALTMSS